LAATVTRGRRRRHREGNVVRWRKREDARVPLQPPFVL
jgi:hypothetical protein